MEEQSSSKTRQHGIKTKGPSAPLLNTWNLHCENLVTAAVLVSVCWLCMEAGGDVDLHVLIGLQRLALSQAAGNTGSGVARPLPHTDCASSGSEVNTPRLRRKSLEVIRRGGGNSRRRRRCQISRIRQIDRIRSYICCLKLKK